MLISNKIIFLRSKVVRTNLFIQYCLTFSRNLHKCIYRRQTWFKMLHTFSAWTHLSNFDQSEHKNWTDSLTDSWTGLRSDSRQSEWNPLSANSNWRIKKLYESGGTFSEKGLQKGERGREGKWDFCERVNEEGITDRGVCGERRYHTSKGWISIEKATQG